MILNIWNVCCSTCKLSLFICLLRSTSVLKFFDIQNYCVSQPCSVKLYICIIVSCLIRMFQLEGKRELQIQVSPKNLWHSSFLKVKIISSHLSKIKNLWRNTLKIINCIYDRNSEFCNFEYRKIQNIKIKSQAMK